MRLIVLSLALATVLIAVPAVAADRIVDDQGIPCVSGFPVVYSTISAAVAAASPGETILVCAGNYVDNVTVNKAHLTFLAQGNVRLTSGGGTPSAFQIWVDGITVQGFEIYGYIRYLECGISVLNGSGHNFLDNQVHDNWYGICVNYGTDHRVQYNVTNDNVRLGILFAGVKGGEVSNNTMTGNGEWGLSVGPCQQPVPTIHHNLSVGSGIRVYKCAAVLTNNTVRSPDPPTAGKHGFWLQDADGAVVTRNAVQSMDTGVLLEGADDTTISYNNVSFSNVGIDVKGSDGVTVTRNYATRSTIVDCRWDSFGTNTLVYNVCRTVDPAGTFK